MLEFLHSMAPLYLLCGFVVGALIGMTGVGGGSLMTPVLILLFGLPPATAVGTDLIYVSVTEMAGAAIHGYNRTINWRVMGLLALGSLPTTLLTLTALYEFGLSPAAISWIITRVLACALVLTVMLLLFRGAFSQLRTARARRFSPKVLNRVTVASGVALGILVPLSSVGAGAITVMMMTFLYPEMRARKIVGTDIAHAVPLTLIAGLGHGLFGSVDWHVATSLLIGSLPGIVVGSLASFRMPDAAVRLSLAAMLLIVATKLLFS